MGVVWVLSDVSLRIECGILPKVSLRTPPNGPYVLKVTRGATEGIYVAIEVTLIAKERTIKRLRWRRLANLVLDVDGNALVGLQVGEGRVYVPRLQQIGHNEFCDSRVRSVALFLNGVMV